MILNFLLATHSTQDMHMIVTNAPSGVGDIGHAVDYANTLMEKGIISKQIQLFIHHSRHDEYATQQTKYIERLKQDGFKLQILATPGISPEECEEFYGKSSFDYLFWSSPNYGCLHFKYLHLVSYGKLTPEKIAYLGKKTGARKTFVLSEHDIKAQNCSLTTSPMGFYRENERLPGVYMKTGTLVTYSPESRKKAFGSVPVNSGARSYLLKVLKRWGLDMTVRCTPCATFNFERLLPELEHAYGIRVLREELSRAQLETLKSNAIFNIVGGDKAFEEALAQGNIPLFLNELKVPFYKGFVKALEELDCPRSIVELLKNNISLLDIANEKPNTLRDIVIGCCSEYTNPNTNVSQEDFTIYQSRVLPALREKFNIKNHIAETLTSEQTGLMH